MNRQFEKMLEKRNIAHPYRYQVIIIIHHSSLSFMSRKNNLSITGNEQTHNQQHPMAYFGEKR